MGHIATCRHCVIGVADTGTPFLLEGPSWLYGLVGGPFLRDRSRSDRFGGMPGRPGLYQATIECRWEPAWAARVPGNEDHAFVFVASEVEPISVFDLALDRYGRVAGFAWVFSPLAAGLARVLHRLRTLLRQKP